MSGTSLNIFCALNATDLDTVKKIQNNVKDVFKDFGRDVHFREVVDYESAFQALSECRNINIRFFSTKGNCYSKDILDFACNVAHHGNAINLQVVQTDDESRLIAYDPSIGKKTFAISSNKLQEKNFLTNLIKTICEPISVYISYGNDQPGGQGRYILEKLTECIGLAFPYLNVVSDIDQVYKDSVSKLINRIKNGEYVIVILNEKYFSSDYSMAEYVGIREKPSCTGVREFRERVYPLILDSGVAILEDDRAMLSIVERWQSKLDESKNLVNSNKKIPEVMRKRFDEKINFLECAVDALANMKEEIRDLTSIAVKSENLLKLVSTVLWAIHQDMFRTNNFRLYNCKMDLDNIIRKVFENKCECILNPSLHGKKHDLSL